MVLGEDGIISQAEKSVNAYNSASSAENQMLQNMDKTLQLYLAGTPNSSGGGNEEGNGGQGGGTPVNAFTISYDPNGGENAPAAQTKIAGEELTIRTAKPTRTSYAFKGWSTTSTGTVEYNAGDSYTLDVSQTLYAVWQKAGYTADYLVTNASASTLASYIGQDISNFSLTINFSDTRGGTKTPHTISDWQILYIGSSAAQSGNRIYLISRSAASTSFQPCTNDVTNYGYVGAGRLRDNSNSKESIGEWNITGTNASYASWAIGGPTVDIFFRAYNLKKSQSVTYSEGAYSNGTYSNYTTINGSQSPWSHTWDSNDSPFWESGKNYSYYWLASPYGPNHAWSVHSSGVGGIYASHSDRAVRPVVCLESGVKVDNTNGVYTLAM